MSSREITVTGRAVSASTLLIAEPVISTRCNDVLSCAITAPGAMTMPPNAISKRVCNLVRAKALPYL